MNSKFNKFLFSLPCRIVLIVMAFFATFHFYLYQDFHYFIDNATFVGCVYLLTALLALASLFVLFSEWIYTLGKREWKKYYLILFYIAVCFIVLFTLVNLVFSILLNTPIQMFRKNFLLMAPYFGVFGTIVVMAFTFALANKKKVVACILAGLIGGMTIFAAVFSWDMIVFKFESEPVVFDVGNGYRIVWATTDEAVGYVKYTYLDEEYTIFDEDSGRINSIETIHNVFVPYEHLQNNKYTVYSTRMLNNNAYGPRSGKTIEVTKNFKGVFSNDFNITIISDTHNVREYCFDAPAKEDTDLLIMLGDFCDYISDDQAIADYLLWPCNRVSKGEIPVLFAKGNHDNRGESASRLQDLLGFESFYYQTYFGDYRFTIIDSGECNPDNFAEFGVVANFEKYREKQLEYLESLDKETGKYDILVVHNPAFGTSKEEVERYNNVLDDFGVDIQLSGHTHKYAFSEEGYKGEKDFDNITSVPVLVSAGVVGDFFKHDLHYTTIHVKDDVLKFDNKSYKKGKIDSDSLIITKS